MKQKVIFIMGLGHSGSTFLQLLLSSHPSIIGFGEIALLLKTLKNQSAPFDLPNCSCGKKPQQCEVWNKFLQDYNPNMTNKELYLSIIKLFQVHFPGKILIDSSKNLDSFKEYYSTYDKNLIDLKVIFLSRDFRGWINSRKKNNKRKNRKDYGLLFNSYKWFYRNFRKLKFLKKINQDFLSINYETLVFNTDQTFKKILHYLELDFMEPDLEKACTHDIFGNRMKNDKKKNTKVYYDHKWMKENNTVLLYPLLIPPYYLNKKLYSSD